MAEAPTLSAAAARERAARQDEQPVEQEQDQAPEPVQVTTAFLVIWQNGEVVVTSDLDAPLMLDHIPTADEILGAAAIVAADRTAERTAGLSAQMTVTTIEGKQRAAMQKMQQAQTAAQAQALLEQEQRRTGRG